MRVRSTRRLLRHRRRHRRRGALIRSIIPLSRISTRRICRRLPIREGCTLARMAGAPCRLLIHMRRGMALILDMIITERIHMAPRRCIMVLLHRMPTMTNMDNISIHRLSLNSQPRLLSSRDNNSSRRRRTSRRGALVHRRLGSLSNSSNLSSRGEERMDIRRLRFLHQGWFPRRRDMPRRIMHMDVRRLHPRRVLRRQGGLIILRQVRPRRKVRLPQGRCLVGIRRLRKDIWDITCLRIQVSMRRTGMHKGTRTSMLGILSNRHMHSSHNNGLMRLRRLERMGGLRGGLLRGIRTLMRHKRLGREEGM